MSLVKPRVSKSTQQTLDYLRWENGVLKRNLKREFTRTAALKKILQSWIDKQSHSRCWYYPDLFQKLIQLLDLSPTKAPGLPPLAEFEAGCRKYQTQEYKKRQEKI